ncbi:hypothetical protein diail_6082 [Diaporthe ilicicola]|nr:hypothetical protein diail_6082 [Diaporthe ilicicola]
MAAGLTPTQMQTPRLPEKDGHDLPSATGEANRPTYHDNLQRILASPPLENGDVLLQETIQETDRLFPLMPQRPDIRGISWFSSALMALFNISPFLDFLNEVRRRGPCSDPVLEALLDLGQSFRNWHSDESTAADQRAAIGRKLRNVGVIIGDNRVDQPPSYQGMTGEGGLPHAIEFTSYLMKRIGTAKFQGNNVPNEVDLSIRFKQLFEFFTVPHAPIRCDCGQQWMRRQAATEGDLAGFILCPQIRQSMNLDHAISELMWDTLSKPRTCPDCGKEVQTNAFLKLAYLPEVLFIHPAFVHEEGGQVHASADAKLTYPERLDMSELRDDPSRTGDQTDCIYRLQSIIICSDVRMTHGTHYKTALRMSEHEWQEFSDLPSPNGSRALKTIEQIRDTADYQPAMLVYVRERSAAPTGNVLPAAGPQLTQPHHQQNATAGEGPAGGGAVGPHGVERFLAAQNDGPAHARPFNVAQLELGQGRKIGDWMWCVFPQAAELPTGSTSANGQRYTINSLAELRAYWAHVTLRTRYMQLLRMVQVNPENDPDVIFGTADDAQKFLASLTLFMLICNPGECEVFRGVLQKLFNGHHHQETGQLVSRWLGAARDTPGLHVAFDRTHNRSPTTPAPGGGGNGGELSRISGDGLPTTTAVNNNPAPVVNSPAPVVNNTPPVVNNPAPVFNNPPPAVNNPAPAINNPPPAVHFTDGRPGPDGRASQDNAPGHDDGTGPSDETGDDTGNHSSVESGDDASNDEANAAYSIGYTLLALADQVVTQDDTQLRADLADALNDRARRLGHLILNLALPVDAPIPIPSPESDERARRLGRHLLFGSQPPQPVAALQGNAQHDNGHNAEPENSHNAAGGALGMDGTFDDLHLDNNHNAGDDSGPSSDADNQSYDEEAYKLLAIPTDPKDDRILACENWPLHAFRAAFRDEGLDWRGLRNDLEKHRIKFLKHFEIERDYSIYHESKLRRVVRKKCPDVKRTADKAELVDALMDYDEKILAEFDYIPDDQDGLGDSDWEEDQSEEYESSLASETEAVSTGNKAGGLKEVDKSVTAAAASRGQKRARDDDDDDEDFMPRNKYSIPMRMRSDSESVV